MPADNLEQPAPGAGCSPDIPFLVASQLTKHFPGVVALDDVSLTIASGEVVALVGHNGAGKSTLIQIFAGLDPGGSYQGTIAVGGRPPQAHWCPAKSRNRFVPQEITALHLTVAEHPAQPRADQMRRNIKGSAFGARASAGRSVSMSIRVPMSLSTLPLSSSS
jgi:ABC-type sugar transport system ATPase subunit